MMIFVKILVEIISRIFSLYISYISIFLWYSIYKIYIHNIILIIDGEYFNPIIVYINKYIVLLLIILLINIKYFFNILGQDPVARAEDL